MYIIGAMCVCGWGWGWGSAALHCRHLSGNLDGHKLFLSPYNTIHGWFDCPRKPRVSLSIYICVCVCNIRTGVLVSARTLEQCLKCSLLFAINNHTNVYIHVVITFILLYMSPLENSKRHLHSAKHLYSPPPR